MDAVERVPNAGIIPGWRGGGLSPGNVGGIVMMLDRLLSEIRKGGSFEIGSLAKKLGTTPGMVEAMLEHLEGRGFLHPYRCNKEECRGCTIQGECITTPKGNQIRLWQVEE